MNKFLSLFRRKKIVVKHPDLLQLYYEPDVYEGYLWYWADTAAWLERNGITVGSRICEQERLER